jgi:hypothetical protein
MTVAPAASLKDGYMASHPAYQTITLAIDPDKVGIITLNRP